MGYNIKSIKEDFKKKGIYYTPEELALFIKSFLPENIKEVYDPTCGSGALLEVFDDDVMKYGQDTNEEQVEVARERLKNFTGAVGDTLQEPHFTDRKFDYIVANPPFSIAWEQNKDKRFTVAPAEAPKSKADYAFILHILDMLSDKGIAVVLGFPGILYRGHSEGKIRQWLVDQNYIEKIVHIAGDKFVDTKIATCLLVLNKNKKNTDILFIDDELKKERVVKFEEVKEEDYNLSVSRYVYEEIVKEVIDPVKVQYKAREQFIAGLRADLELDRIVCGFENLDHQEYLNQIKEVIREYEESESGRG